MSLRLLVAACLAFFFCFVLYALYQYTAHARCRALAAVLWLCGALLWAGVSLRLGHASAAWIGVAAMLTYHLWQWDWGNWAAKCFTTARISVGAIILGSAASLSRWSACSLDEAVGSHPNLMEAWDERGWDWGSVAAHSGLRESELWHTLPVGVLVTAGALFSVGFLRHRSKPTQAGRSRHWLAVLGPILVLGLWGGWLLTGWVNVFAWAERGRWGLVRCVLTVRPALARAFAQRPSPLRPVDNLESDLTLLHLAAYRGEPREIHSLLAAGAAVDAGCWTPLDFAAAAGRTANIEALLRRGAEVNERWRLWHWTPLFWAVSRGHAETVKALLDAGADVRAVDSILRTPLHHAAARGQVTAIQPLVAAGAPLTAGDAQGRLPLHYAAAIHRADILGALLKAGGEVSARDLDGQTPLHALFTRGPMTARGTLAIGPDMPRRMDKPEPSFAGATGAIQLLLDAGADVNAQDNWPAIKKGGKTGRTPLDWAQESLTEVSAEDRKTLADCVDLLLRHGAKTAEELDAEQHESPPPRDEPAR